MTIHWNILDNARKSILPLFKTFKDDGFYLAGGTGLALQLGHRDSIDFDFFKEGSFDTRKLIKSLEEIFIEHTLVITQQEKDTVSCLINNSIQLSFFGYHHTLLKPLIETEHFAIASVADIACMKFSAITSRSLEKDYVDLYFILKEISLLDLLILSQQKYPTLDSSLILKSLVYFDDVLEEPIIFKEGHDVSFKDVKISIEQAVTAYFNAKS
jgi:hypothetical protein